MASMHIRHQFNPLKLTQVNFNATNLNPLASKRLMIFPTSPLWTPSGLTMIKVRSLLAAIACENKEKNANIEQIINLYSRGKILTDDLELRGLRRCRYKCRAQKSHSRIRLEGSRWITYEIEFQNFGGKTVFRNSLKIHAFIASESHSLQPGESQ